MLRPLGSVMVIGFSAISRFTTGTPCTKKCPVAPESDMAYSTACFSLVVLKIVPAFGSSWSYCCVTMEFQAFFAHRLFGRKTGVAILFICSDFSQFGSHLGVVVWSMWAGVSSCFVGIPLSMPILTSSKYPSLTLDAATVSSSSSSNAAK